MDRILALCLCVLLLSAATALAGEAGRGDAVAAPPTSDRGEQIAAAGTMNEENRKAEAMSGDGQAAAAREVNGDAEAKAREMSGMSIVGNDEAPKSLYIVPWKSSEIGGETRLDAMLNEGDGPVDREVFQRQIEFYRVRTNQ